MGHASMSKPEKCFRSRWKAARLAAARARHKSTDSMDKKRSAWELAACYWNRFTIVILNGLAVLTFGIGIYIVWQSVTQKVIAVAPIAVPKVLAENGYTSDVAAQRLQSTINDVVEVGHLIKAGPNIAQQAELPSIAVPSTGWSVDAIASFIRSFFRIESRWNVSGDITIADNKLWLHLRMNGRDLYTTAAGVDPQPRRPLCQCGFWW
jgi:hypothetical protein